METPLVTKNDTYANIVREGIERGYEVIPEFRVWVHKQEISKSIDLVWATRQDRKSTRQDRPNLEYWILAATFEIEACDVRINKEFRRHLVSLPNIHSFNQLIPVVHCIPLYTAAFDRSEIKRISHAVDICERAKAAEPYGVHVFTVGSNQWLNILPKNYT